jgi:hypothetical protein
MNMKKSIWIPIAVIGGLFILIKGCQFLVLQNALKTNEEISRLDTNIYSKVPPREYLNLFLNNKNLICINTVTSKHRNPIAEFQLDQLRLQVVKLDTIDNLRVPDILKENFVATQMSMNTYFTDYFNDKEISVNYKRGYRETAKTVFFTLFGDKTQIIEKNDSIAYYYSNFKNFSIRYGVSAKIDIYGKIKENSQKNAAPIEIMFFKHNESLYLILLFPEDRNSRLDTHVLSKLVRGSR